MLEILQTMEQLSLYWFCSRSLRESTATLGTFKMKQILNVP